MQSLLWQEVMRLIKFTLIWISQNLAIPFWIVGHIHLSIHSFHDLVEIASSIGMNILVAIGFVLDYKMNESIGVCAPQSKTVWLGSDLSR